jgi:hypothetical protein
MLPTNLYEPVAGDQGSTGIFSDKALTITPQVWAINNRGLTVGLGVAALASLGGAIVAVARKK